MGRFSAQPCRLNRGLKGGAQGGTAALGRRRSGAGQAELPHVGALGPESGFAIAQIEATQTPETLIEAKLADFVPGPLEAMGPFRQRISVVLAEADDVPPFQTRLRRLFAQAGLAGQHSAGKDVLLDEVRPPAIGCEQLVPDGDDLQPRAAAPGENVSEPAA